MGAQIILYNFFVILNAQKTFFESPLAYFALNACNWFLTVLPNLADGCSSFSRSRIKEIRNRAFFLLGLNLVDLQINMFIEISIIMTLLKCYYIEK